MGLKVTVGLLPATAVLLLRLLFVGCRGSLLAELMVSRTTGGFCFGGEFK